MFSYLLCGPQLSRNDEFIVLRERRLFTAFWELLAKLDASEPLTKENGLADSRWLYKPVKPDSVFSNVNNDSCLLLASLLSKV